MASTGVTRGQGELTFGEGDVLLGLAHDVHRVHLQARHRIRATEGGREVASAPRERIRARAEWNRGARVRARGEPGKNTRGEGVEVRRGTERVKK